MGGVDVGKGIPKEFTIDKTLKFSAAFWTEILCYGVIQIGLCQRQKADTIGRAGGAFGYIEDQLNNLFLAGVHLYASAK